MATTNYFYLSSKDNSVRKTTEPTREYFLPNGKKWVRQSILLKYLDIITLKPQKRLGIWLIKPKCLMSYFQLEQKQDKDIQSGGGMAANRDRQIG